VPLVQCQPLLYFAGQHRSYDLQLLYAATITRLPYAGHHWPCVLDVCIRVTYILFLHYSFTIRYYSLR
jgi:hypothetical protein